MLAENGYGKRTLLDELNEETKEWEPVYRITKRGGKGVKTMNLTQKTGKLIAIREVTDNDDLMIINKSGIAIRLEIENLRTLGRATQGVKLINLKGKDTIAAVSIIIDGKQQRLDEEASLENEEINDGEELDNTPTNEEDTSPQE